MKKTTAILFMIGATAFAATADDANLLKNGNFSRGKTNWVTAGTVTEEGNAGVLTLTGSLNRAISRQVIEISHDADYKISAKVSADKKVNQVLLGIVPVSKQGYDIFYRNSNGAVKNTLTELSEAYQKGSDTVILKDNPAWKAGWLAFNAKEDMSDLPNYTIVAFEKFERKDGKIIITLPKAYNRSYPAGTKVRLHVDGATYPYTSIIRKGFPGTVDASGTIGKNTKIKFPAGTVGFKALLLVLPVKSAADVKVQFRDMKIEQLTADK